MDLAGILMPIEHLLAQSFHFLLFLGGIGLKVAPTTGGSTFCFKEVGGGGEESVRSV